MIARGGGPDGRLHTQSGAVSPLQSLQTPSSPCLCWAGAAARVASLRCTCAQNVFRGSRSITLGARWRRYAAVQSPSRAGSTCARRHASHGARIPHRIRASVHPHLLSSHPHPRWLLLRRCWLPQRWPDGHSLPAATSSSRQSHAEAARLRQQQPSCPCTPAGAPRWPSGRSFAVPRAVTRTPSSSLASRAVRPPQAAPPHRRRRQSGRTRRSPRGSAQQSSPGPSPSFSG